MIVASACSLSRLVQVLIHCRVKPVNYDLSIHDIEFLGNWTYQGTVKIDIDIRNTGKDIVLNAHRLTLHGATLSTEHTKTEQASKASNISYDKENQRATLHFDQEFAVTSKAVLEIEFEGTMNNVWFAIIWSLSFVAYRSLSSTWQVSIDLATSQR
jgi:hypothetical protein